MKGKALRRALQSSDAIRVNADLPLIQDVTELITPQIAEEMLKHNQNNRPVNWGAVERLAEIMKRGDWQFHAQGIIRDKNGNILTGQTRLWAVVYSDTPVYMRVSSGSPAESAFVIDRGRPQSSRDLAARRTDRKHSPTEASIARCVCILDGLTKPTADEIARAMTSKNQILQTIIAESKGTKKTKAVLMVLGAICHLASNQTTAQKMTKEVEISTTQFEMALLPYKAETCWGKGASFGMALEKAVSILRKRA